jgi:hypothetical protein
MLRLVYKKFVLAHWYCFAICGNIFLNNWPHLLATAIDKLSAYNIKFDPIGVANIQRRLQALEHTFYVCVVCSREFSYAHKGEADVRNNFIY